MLGFPTQPTKPCIPSGSMDGCETFLERKTLTTPSADYVGHCLGQNCIQIASTTSLKINLLGSLFKDLINTVFYPFIPTSLLVRKL